MGSASRGVLQAGCSEGLATEVLCAQTNADLIAETSLSHAVRQVSPAILGVVSRLAVVALPAPDDSSGSQGQVLHRPQAGPTAKALEW